MLLPLSLPGEGFSAFAIDFPCDAGCGPGRSRGRTEGCRRPDARRRAQDCVDRMMSPDLPAARPVKRRDARRRRQKGALDWGVRAEIQHPCEGTQNCAPLVSLPPTIMVANGTARRAIRRKASPGAHSHVFPGTGRKYDRGSARYHRGKGIEFLPVYRWAEARCEQSTACECVGGERQG
jgi:hypothetical protein